MTRSSQQAKGFSVFDFNYIPQNPLVRDKAQGLIDVIARLDTSGIAAHPESLGQVVLRFRHFWFES